MVHIFFQNGGTETLRLNINSAEFRRANYKISGSATSTGSFAQGLHIAG